MHAMLELHFKSRAKDREAKAKAKAKEKALKRKSVKTMRAPVDMFLIQMWAWIVAMYFVPALFVRLPSTFQFFYLMVIHSG